MTTLAPPSAEPRLGPVPDVASGRIRRLARARVGQTAWVLPATAGVLVLATILYVVNLTVSGYANIFYSGAAWAASQSWSAWFMGSIDPANFITVDKPPLATMVMGLSVRLFGLSSASILLPEALMGVATVALVMATVRRTFGGAASIIAGLVTALTPAAVLIFRYNNPDALLTMLFAGAAYTFIRALESDKLRWLALTSILVGLAFETKLLQAFLVLPAFFIVYAIAGRGSWRRRLVGLTVSAIAVIAASSWWIIPMTVLPASARAYVGGATDGTALNLVLGYNGLFRILGDGVFSVVGMDAPAGAATMAAGTPSFSGTPGVLRLFNSELGGQIGWFLPLSLVGLVAGLVARFRAPRTDLARAAFLMWGLWLAVHAVVFSFMSGVIHPYYAVVMAPAVGALVGGGVVAIWRARDRFPAMGAVLGLSLAGSAGLAMLLLDRTPSFVPGLGVLVLAVTALTVPVLALRPSRRFAKLQVAAGGLALAMLLAGPAAYAVSTMQTAYSGGSPSAGPSTGQSAGPGGQAGNGGFGAGPGGAGQPPTGGPGGPANSAKFGGGRGPGAGGPGGSSLSTATLDYLVANQGTATWLVAVSDSTTASQIELSTGKAVISMGGFTGTDNAMTLETMKSLVASGRLRFVVAGDSGGRPGGQPGVPGGQASSPDATSWVTSACTAVTVDGAATSVYDCAGAVSG
jgi:4-amino-4-deoxy-L-arabinose transferase-like glycosyltransferase